MRESFLSRTNEEFFCDMGFSPKKLHFCLKNFKGGSKLVIDLFLKKTREYHSFNKILVNLALILCIKSFFLTKVSNFLGEKPMSHFFGRLPFFHARAVI